MNNSDSTHDRLRVVAVHDITPGLATYLFEKMGQYALADPTQDINVLIRSTGGSVYESLSAIDAFGEIKRLLEPDAKLVGVVHGYAFSAASLLLQALDVRKMTETSYLMIHGITTGGGHRSDEEDVERDRAHMRALRQTYTDIYSMRSTKDAEYWEKIMKVNTPNYFNAKDALEAGFVDEIVPSYLNQFRAEAEV